MIFPNGNSDVNLISSDYGKDNSHIANRDDFDSGKYSLGFLLRGRCMDFCDKFVKKFPNLKKIIGFYGENNFYGAEHAWCIDIDSAIIDPTVDQFGTTEINPENYRELNPNIDQVYIGKCMECDEEIYGLITDPKSYFCSQECENMSIHYLNSLT